ncbi:M28 family peptidase, partial [Brachyspira catarrhinii]
KGRKGENIYSFLEGESEEYIIVASHYDSRIVAEKDRKIENRNKPIDGANDGASSSGILLELMNSLKDEKLPYGICFILFDLEDDGNLFYSGNGLTETDWIQGSIAFVNDKILEREKIKFGILLDMVGGSNAKFKYESFAYTYYPNIYEKIWGFADDLGYKDYFVKEHYGMITDDHIPFLMEKIPFIDIIDMGYKYHHTTEDTIDKIDIKTLEAVGRTMEYTLKNADKIF